MNGRGRPLRFVALVVAGWASARVVMLWPDGATLPEAIDALLPLGEHEAVADLPRPAAAPVTQEHSLLGKSPIAQQAADVRQVDAGREIGPAKQGRAVRVAMQEQPLGAPPGAMPPAPATPLVAAATEKPSRWSASAWFVTRRGAPAGGAMLGGDQAGVRIAYALDARQRVRAYVRATAPLAMAGREAAAGLEWQPTRLPIRLVAEQRAMLDGGSSGPAIGAVGGVSAVKLPLAFSLEAYAQAGAVFREGSDAFADGAVRATREVGSIRKIRLQIGAGAWGAAQRGARRLDIGPSATASVPLGEKAVRIALDWRERVAGDARPGSGPALSIGTDF